MGHAPRTARCSWPASARTPDKCGPEDHPLLLAVQREAVVEELGALLAPVAGPIAAGGAEAVEAGKDVEGVGSGHDALLEWLVACSEVRLGTTGRLIALGLLERRPLPSRIA